MIDATLVAFILGFIVLQFTILWSARRRDKRLSAIEGALIKIQTGLARVRVELARLKAEVKDQNERLDRMDDRFDRQDSRFDRQDERSDELLRSISIVSSKVDKAQGNLDVLVYGDRGVSEPVARERAALEERVEETVGN